MTRKDKYHVCRSCEGDWCWERDLWKHTHCNVCGSQFPRPKTSWNKGTGKTRQWELEWPALPNASQQRNWVSQSAKPAKKVYGALNQVWNFIPEEAQQAIASAGFRVQDRAMAKGMGSPPRVPKVKKALAKERATPPPRSLLQRKWKLPKDFLSRQRKSKRMCSSSWEWSSLLSLLQTSRSFADSASTRCQRALKCCWKSKRSRKKPQKSTLQLKINKTKTTYTDLLTEMQQLQEVLSKQQQEVTALQQELQDRVQAEQPPPGPSLFQTLQDLGVQISDEQAAKLAGFRFQVAEAEDAKLPTESEKDPPPPGNLPTDMDLESPPGLQPSNPNKERNGRSRSPKGGDGDKGKPGDNKV